MASAVVCSLLFFLSLSVHFVPGEGSTVSATSVMETYVGSNITTDVTWDISQSPIYVNKTLWITSSGSLTIYPGTEVRFGKGSSLRVNGSVKIGGEGDEVTLGPQDILEAGSWEGVVLGENSVSRFEMTIIQGANVSLIADGPSDAVMRNISISDCNSTFHLDHGSEIKVYNSTLDHSRIEVIDNRSVLRTFSYLKGIIVDHLGSPCNNVRFELMDHEGILRMSYIVNSTGEIPSVLIEGSSFVKDGRNNTIGTYRISLSDDPFTHYVNSTLLFNGTVPQSIVLRFTWPPELSSYPKKMYVYEDALSYHYTEVLDRNGVGEVDLVTSSPAVSYDLDLGRLEFLYTNETISFETVEILLDDGYDRTVYMIEVNVTPMNDPVFVELSSHMVYVREDVLTEIMFDITDEDTPIDEIDVSTSDPENVTYHPEGPELVLLYGDGTPPEFNITLIVSDGQSSVQEKLAIYFQAVFYPPFFIGSIEDIVIDEDTFFVLDLEDRIGDPDIGEKVSLTVNQDDHGVFSSRVEGRKVYIETLADTYGSGKVELVIRDEQGLTTSRTINVTIRPIDDPPVLSGPLVIEAVDREYIFNVTYNDIEGDIPLSVTLHMGDDRYPMVLSPEGGLDPMVGILYSFKLTPLPGSYIVGYSCRQGGFEVNISYGTLLIPETEVCYVLRGYNGSLEVTVWGSGSGIEPDLGLSGDDQEPPPPGMVYLGCSFRIFPGDLEPTRASINIWLFDFREDITPLSSRLMYLDSPNWTEAGTGSYTSSVRVYSIILHGNLLNRTFVMFTELDSDYDTDRDGVKNLLDAFPDDPLEWNDTDRDGTGDNSDTDDDGDGFPDDIEVLSGTDPLNPASYPQDSDEDDILDYLDEDDDGDGMPDDWELMFFLDPLDPSDAMDDPDGDGSTNLEEFIRGTDPLVRDREPETGEDMPVWIIILIAAVLLVLLAGVVGLFIFSRKQNRWEMDEASEEWEIAGELEPEDAVDCPVCGEVFPLWFEKCPKCGGGNPYDEE
ncbi:MAG: hypothetical protein JXA22_02860 [Candidatus Thermoplasmatota archaeon]|nr:hypothetical protein [Candidatus Thermoplasmatota archaeon]